ncbi:MAG: TlpA family protein disulfide reductase, partial [Isosphaeraceae bacterium]
PVRRPVAARPSPPSPSMAAEAHTPRPVEPRRRPTWGEVAALASSRSGERKVAAVDPDTRPTRLVRQEPLDLSRPRTEVEPTCDYDSRLRRVLDFQLPDVNGKPTRFRDFDADLILLDFWGTWCQPCVRSIPHLVDLQKKLGGKTLVVVGIACEQDAPGQSAARVAKVAERLKVNYPLLLSRNDGSCPLQEALHVQAFPTMILLDREGRLLWRDQGATPATLSRLDRMISVATQVDGSKVRR